MSWCGAGEGASLSLDLVLRTDLRTDADAFCALHSSSLDGYRFTFSQPLVASCSATNSLPVAVPSSVAAPSQPHLDHSPRLQALLQRVFSFQLADTTVSIPFALAWSAREGVERFFEANPSITRSTWFEREVELMIEREARPALLKLWEKTVREEREIEGEPSGHGDLSAPS